MESRFKLRISRMFRSSFGSCRSRNLSDIIEKAVFVPQNHRNFQKMKPIASPKARPFPSICKPICPETDQTVDNDCIITAPPPPRRKVSEKHSPFLVSASFINGRICPPASPVSPLNPPFHHPKQFDFYGTCSMKNKSKNNQKKKSNKKFSSNNYLFSSSSVDSTNIYGGGWWFSSEEETDTLFSSRSLSSDDSLEYRRRRSHRKKNSSQRRGRAKVSKRSEMGVLALKELEGKVKGSFAVVKTSSDPYSDFRTSMLEMIVERQIFAAKDLEHLLHCFLSLNSHHHHRIIVQVFTEIYEALF